MKFLLLLVAACFSTYVNVMLPLTTVSNDGKLDTSIENYFAPLKNAGVHGVMVDVWWGIAEKSEKSYNFAPYVQLADLCAKYGLKLQCVMSFHRCGGNVGDTCDIPIPSWVRSKSNVWYKDMDVGTDNEYISLDSDNDAVFNGRKPLTLYHDFMKAFASAMGSRMGSTVEEVQVGLGPCGELRYPGYQSDRWSFPGVGEFQAWSDKMKTSLQSYMKNHGHADWNSPPTDAGSYNTYPTQTQFYTNGYKSDYGKLFLQWYSDLLIEHGRTILTDAVSIFKPLKTQVAMKMAGIHWWYNHNSHGAEATTGYINSLSDYNTYTKVAQMCAQLGVILDFTCFEMSNDEQDALYGCNPESLVYQVISAAKNAGATLSAENALERYDDKAYNKVVDNACRKGGKVQAFTYLRLTPQLINNQSYYNSLKNFISNISSC